MRDRYLFSADRKVSEYRSVLEITRGRARLLTPSSGARRVRWVVSAALGIAMYALLFVFVRTESFGGLADPVAAGVLATVGTVLFFVGLFVVFHWWDLQSLPLLGYGAAQSVDLVLLGARSFGTFQDVRARTPSGEEIHLIVDGRASQFWEAVQLLEGRAAAPA